MADDERTFVVVGASLAGAKAVETLRGEGFTGRIVLVGAEEELPYERPPLSKGYLLGKQAPEEARVHDQDWYRQQHVDLMLGVRVTGIDPAAHAITLGDGATGALGYDTLLLATGSRVRYLDVPGGETPDVRYLRTLPDATDLLARLRERRQVVIVGAGWIGLEVAAAARAHGCTVTVIEVDRLPLRRVLGDEVAAIFRDLHQAHGVGFRFGVGVRAFGTDSADRLTSVVLDDGTEIPADVAVVGVGILPRTELAEAAGLAVDNGVLADAALRTSDPDIYACGDVVNWAHPLLGRRIRVEHWANALDGGAAAARSMLGQPVSYDKIPYFFSDQYEAKPMIGMEYAGFVMPGEYDRVVFRGDPSVSQERDPEFIAFWVKENRVLAGMNVNVWDVTDSIQALVRAGYAGTGVDLAKLADPDVPLDVLIR